MEALDNKIKENRRMKKLNLNEGLFSSLLLWKASLTIFVADFVFRKGGLYWEKSTKLSPPPGQTFRFGQSLSVSCPGTFLRFGGGR